MRDKRASLPEWKVPADAPADEASMVSVDRFGFKLRITSGPRMHSVRIAFPREVTSAEACHVVFIEMLRQVRQRVK